MENQNVNLKTTQKNLKCLEQLCECISLRSIQKSPVLCAVVASMISTLPNYYYLGWVM